MINPETWKNSELWLEFLKFITGLVITAIIAFISAMIGGAITAAGGGTTLPVGVTATAYIFGTLMTLYGVYATWNEFQEIYHKATISLKNLHEGAKYSNNDQQLKEVGQQFAQEASEPLLRTIRLVANIAVAKWAAGKGYSQTSPGSQKIANTVKKGPKPKEAPKNLAEQLLLEDANLGAGKVIQGGSAKSLGDAPRLVANYGGKIGDWYKMAGTQNKVIDGASVEVHWFRNPKLNKNVEFKFKRPYPKSAPKNQ